MRKCSWSINKGDTVFGYFHQWGTDVGFNSDGEGVNYSVAIVENEHGEVSFVSISVAAIVFLPDNTSRKEYDEHKKIFGF